MPFISAFDQSNSKMQIIRNSLKEYAVKTTMMDDCKVCSPKQLLLVNLKANNSGVKNGASFFQSFGNPEEQNNPTSLQSYVNSNRNGTSPSDSNDFKRTNIEFEENGAQLDEINTHQESKPTVQPEQEANESGQDASGQPQPSEPKSER